MNGICSSSIGSIDSPLSSSITPSLFHSKLKTFLFCKSFPPQPSFSSSGLTSRMIRRTVYRYFWSYPFRIVEYADVVVNWCYLKTQCWFVQYHIGNESVPIQLAQCRFPGLAISNANMLIHFFQIWKQFYQTALGNCHCLKLPKRWLQFKKKKNYCFIFIIFGTVSIPVTAEKLEQWQQISKHTQRIVQKVHCTQVGKQACLKYRPIIAYTAISAHIT